MSFLAGLLPGKALNEQMRGFSVMKEPMSIISLLHQFITFITASQQCHWSFVMTICVKFKGWTKMKGALPNTNRLFNGGTLPHEY